jgi:hypothetical protein
MFMPAHVLADPQKTAMWHVDFERTPYEEVKAKKLMEAKTGMEGNSWAFSRKAMDEGRTLRDSIAREGVRSPVDLHHPTSYSEDRRPELGEGHHRVFTANDLNPNMEVPVRHKEYDANSFGDPGSRSLGGLASSFARRLAQPLTR